MFWASSFMRKENHTVKIILKKFVNMKRSEKRDVEDEAQGKSDKRRRWEYLASCKWRCVWSTHTCTFLQVHVSFPSLSLIPSLSLFPVTLSLSLSLTHSICISLTLSISAYYILFSFFSSWCRLLVSNSRQLEIINWCNAFQEQIIHSATWLYIITRF